MRDFRFPDCFDKMRKDSSSAEQEARLQNVETEKTIPFKKVWEKLKRAEKAIIYVLTLITATINNSWLCHNILLVFLGAASNSAGRSASPQDATSVTAKSVFDARI